MSAAGAEIGRAAAPRSTSGTQVERLNLRRVYIFPTRHGVLLGAMVAVILMGSINYDNALSYLLTFLLSGLFVVGMLQTFRNLVGLGCAGASAEPVFAPHAARFVVTLDNRGGGPRTALTLERKVKRETLLGARTPLAELRLHDLAAGQLGRIEVARGSSRRGWLELGRIRLESRFPLGLFRAWAYFAPATRCLVYPEPRGRLPLPWGGGGTRAARGASGAGQDEFSGFKRYRPGDPPRAIAWKALARSDEMLVKQFTEGQPAEIALRWNATAMLPDTETRLSQLARWVLDAETLGAAYGLVLPGTRIEPGNGAAHRHRCLAALALYGEPA